MGFQSQGDTKQQQQSQVLVKASLMSDSEITTEIQEQKTTINPSSKKPKAVTFVSMMNDRSENSQRIELSNYSLVKPDKATKSLDLLYTNMLFEIEKRIWSEDLTRDEFEKIIGDFEAFKRANRPDTLSKQSKDSLKQTEARFSYLINKWDLH